MQFTTTKNRSVSIKHKCVDLFIYSLRDFRYKTTYSGVILRKSLFSGGTTDSGFLFAAAAILKQIVASAISTNLLWCKIHTMYQDNFSIGHRRVFKADISSILETREICTFISVDKPHYTIDRKIAIIDLFIFKEIFVVTLKHQAIKGEHDWSVIFKP